MKRKKIPQNEFNWGAAESFALVADTAIDGDRVAAEKAKQTMDRREAKNNQLQLTNENPTH